MKDVDPCQFTGDIREWRTALVLESRLQKQMEEEDDEPDRQTSDLVNLLKGVTNTSVEAAAPDDCDEDYLHAPDVDESLRVTC